MNHRMPAGMEEATRLTQAGRLAEATAVIQRMLGGTLSPEDSSATSDGPVMAAQPPSPTPILTPAALLPAGDAPATSAEPSDTSPPEAQPTGQIARLRALLRRRPGGLGRQVSRPIPDQARKDVWAGGQLIEGSYS